MNAHNALTNDGIDHALIGGLALATLGVNRATSDVDFLVDGQKRETVRTALLAAGFKVRAETQEVLQFEGPGYVDVLFANRPISKMMLNDAKVLPPFQIKCLGVEDIIGLKIQAYMNNKRREFRDKADIQALIETHPTLNWNRIKQYADTFNQWEEICRLRSLVS